MGVLIMKDYLAIIRKLDFIDLFKYGHFTISYAVPFDGNISAHADDMELFDMLTSRMNMYEYSFEYLIIHFNADDYNDQYISIDIRNVCALYTFDQEAKKEMSISFDPRIQLHVSPWADKFDKLQRNLLIKQSQRGIDNLWTIFDLPTEDLFKCREIVTPSIIQEVFREFYNYERPSGDQSIWTYLLRYERHSFYPKDMIGYFCDFIHVFCNFSEKKELNGEVAESTQLFPLLIECKNPQFASLVKIVESSPLYKITKEVAGCRFAIVAPLFLFLKAKFADGIEHKPDKEFIDYTKKVSGFECSIAIYLLGLSLGYDKTYDSFYESAELPFFKRVLQPSIPSDSNDGKEVRPFPFHDNGKVLAAESNTVSETDKKESLDTEETKVIPSEETLSTRDKDYQGTVQAPPQSEMRQGQLFSDNNNSDVQEQLPIIWMRNKKQDVQPAFNDEEKSKLDSLGYKAVKRFDDTVMNAIARMNFDPEKEKRRFSTSKSQRKK